MAAQVDIASDEMINMPRAIRSTYLLWKEGIDVHPMYSVPTYYRHRSQLLAYGVDIALPCEKNGCTVIPMFRQVTGEPVEVPTWAFDQGLVFGGRA